MKRRIPRVRRPRTRGPAVESADPETDDGAGRVRRARRDRRPGDRARAADPGVHRQAVPDPIRVDGADARHRPAGARGPGQLPLRRPRDRGHRRLPSTRLARTVSVVGSTSTPRPRRARSRSTRNRTRTSSSGSWPARATRFRSRTATRWSTGWRRRSPSSGRAAVERAATCPSRSRSRRTTTS